GVDVSRTQSEVFIVLVPIDVLTDSHACPVVCLCLISFIFRRLNVEYNLCGFSSSGSHRLEGTTEKPIQKVEFPSFNNSIFRHSHSYTFSIADFPVPNVMN